MSQPSTFARGAALAAALAMTASSLPAMAQPAYPPPPPPPDQGAGPPPGYQPGPAYGDSNVPPPEGWSPQQGNYDNSPQAQDEDARYAQAVQQWSAENCVQQRNNNAAAGAIVGGVLGALVGSSIAGRGNHAAGAVFGGATGAIAGASIGASQTSPGCPPGYVVREGAPPMPAFVFVGGYGYVAPPGYRPWIWVGGRWVYRPYPYHRYWYRHERGHGWH